MIITSTYTLFIIVSHVHVENERNNNDYFWASPYIVNQNSLILSVIYNTLQFILLRRLQAYNKSIVWHRLLTTILQTVSGVLMLTRIKA